LNGLIVKRDIATLRTAEMLRFTMRLFNGNLQKLCGSLRMSMSRDHPDDTRHSLITWSLGILPEFQAGVSLEQPLKSKSLFEHEPAQNAGRMPTLQKM
jgi:hypothetical protein